MRWMMAVAATAVVAGFDAWAGPPVLIGVDAQAAQLVRLDPTTGASTVIGPVGNGTVAALAWDSDRGILYAASTQTHELLRVDPQTGATTVVGSTGVGCCMHGLEYNPHDGVLYGTKIATNQLYRVSPVTGAATFVAPLPPIIGSLAFDPALPAGTMYASDTFTLQLSRIDITTGATAVVGSFGSVGAFMGVGLAFHPALGLFASSNLGSVQADDLLYRVDTSTGQATLVGPTGTSNLLGLAFVTDVCYPDCNEDGVLTVADFGCFQTKFVAGDPYADCNGDGLHTVADFGCFQTRFVAGCP